MFPVNRINHSNFNVPMALLNGASFSGGCLLPVTHPSTDTSRLVLSLTK